MLISLALVARPPPNIAQAFTRLKQVGSQAHDATYRLLPPLKSGVESRLSHQRGKMWLSPSKSAKVLRISWRRWMAPARLHQPGEAGRDLNYCVWEAMDL